MCQIHRYVNCQISNHISGVQVIVWLKAINDMGTCCWTKNKLSHIARATYYALAEEEHRRQKAHHTVKPNNIVSASDYVVRLAISYSECKNT